MAGPVDLDLGGAHQFPTWMAGNTTTLYVENMSADKDGKVTVHAGNQQEDVSAGKSARTSIVRSWAGINISIANTGETKMKVWTA